MTDKAGQQYWNDNWAREEQGLFSPDSRLRNYSARVLAQKIEEALSPIPPGSTVLEAGCANSTFLPYIASLGFQIAGIDYSPVGCDKFAAHLRNRGLSADIACANIFDPPSRMKAAYDAVVSFGLAEHFDNTAEIVGALTAYLRPRGRMLTVIPNLQGLVGFAQNLVGPKILSVHQIMSHQALAGAHSEAGLELIASGYLLPVNFGALNYNESAPRHLFMARKLLTGLLARLSYAAWAIDRVWKLPETALLSPYAYCIADKR